MRRDTAQRSASDLAASSGLVNVSVTEVVERVAGSSARKSIQDALSTHDASAAKLALVRAISAVTPPSRAAHFRASR